MTHFYRRQPPRGAKVAGSSALGKGITAHFLFNGTFASSVRGKSGNPVVTAGPYIRSGPNGRFAQGTGAGKIVTDLLPSALGMAGAAPRSIIAEFDMPDTNQSKAVFSFGDASGRPRSQFTLDINSNFRTVRLNTFGNDFPFSLHTIPGSGFRVFLALTYDGNVGITLRAWSTINTTGQVVATTQTATLNAPLNTGDTVPLNLMGGGTYNFASMVSALHFLSFYGGRVLSLAEIERIRADRHQVMAPPQAFPYASLAARLPPADTSLAGTAAARASAGGALSTAISLAGVAVARASTAGALSGSAGGAALAGACVARAGATGALTTSISMAGAATARASAAAALSTAMPLVGAAAAAASAYGTLATGIALRGAAVVSASASGALDNISPPAERIDISKIHPSRIVVFGGSGSRVTLFDGSGSRVTPFEGSGSRVTPFDGSGSRVTEFE